MCSQEPTKALAMMGNRLANNAYLEQDEYVGENQV